MMDYLKELHIPQTFNMLSAGAVALQFASDIILLSKFAVMENNEPSIDFRCDAKLSDKDLTQGKCFDQYEEQYNKFSFPVYGFVLVNFAAILIVCGIYSLCVFSTVNKLEKSEGYGDAEGECSEDERASLILRRPSNFLFMKYCFQLALRFALGIFFIILQIAVLYPRSLPSNFVCNLGEEVNHEKPNSPANATQTQTQTYKCHNQNATMKSHWIIAVAVLNGIFAFFVFVEIVYILCRALRNEEFMGNKQFYSDHLRILGSKRQPTR